MLFNSYIFILVFLPLCLVGYFTLNHFKKYKLANAFLLGMSCWFYGYFNFRYLIIIISSVLVNFIIYKCMDICKTNYQRKSLLISGLIFNIGLIFYFKYFNFFIDNFNAIFHTTLQFEKILLPLGISFFTFQQISFVIDAYRKEVPHYSFIEYAVFVTYFPQLIAGPIVTHDELIPQIKDENKRKFDWQNFSMGIYAFVLGLAKKILIADILGNVVNVGFSDIANLNTTNAIITMLSYTFQIYFDFSGYCDMAIGLAKMMNIDLPINFNSPYKAFTIVEFWERWHITLTRFFTKYIYIPLGGNRKGKNRTYLNILIVFIVSGLWHGAAWTFIVWGLLHGIFSIITRHFKNFFKKLHPAFSWLVTFLFINLTWVIFRADTLLDALQFFKNLLSFNFGGISQDILNCFQLREITTPLNILFPTLLINYPKIILIVYFIISLYIVLNCQTTVEKMKKFKPTVMNCVMLAILLLWCIVSFTSISTFLYFNF